MLPCSNAHHCVSCCKACHATCGKTIGEEGYGSGVLCEICDKNRSQTEHRDAAIIGLTKQGDRMKAASSAKFKAIATGTNVRIGIPNEDREKIGAKNVIGVVMDEQDGFYTIGTQHGIIQRKFVRRSIAPVAANFIETASVPNTAVSLRTCVGLKACRSTSSLKSCNCAKGCQSKFCPCKKQNVLCNSGCHDSKGCLNKS